MIDFQALASPFPPASVSWRVGSTTSDKKRGMALAFIDARDVMERLDAVCGPAGWQCDYPHANGKTVCRIGIKVGDEWVWKADGAGDTDVEAEKGALSDAFKRAAVRWGIGRYLYDLPSPWVELEAAGRSYKIPDGELRRLGELLGRKASAPAAAPAAKPKDDEPPNDTPQEVALRLIGDIEGCKSVAELEEYKKTAAFRGAFKSLPDALKEQVIDVGARCREELTAGREAA
jgi:hypothetical protein